MTNLCFKIFQHNWMRLLRRFAPRNDKKKEAPRNNRRRKARAMTNMFCVLLHLSCVKIKIHITYTVKRHR